MSTVRHPSALHWLAEAAPDPDHCRRTWERTRFGLALLPAGRRWDVLHAPGPLGRPAAALLDRLGGGPVLEDPDGDTVGFLVPVGTAERWTGTGIRASGDGTWIAVPHPTRPTRGPHWLIPPHPDGRLVDPRALELALHDAAAHLRGPDRDGTGGVRDGRERTGRDGLHWIGPDGTD
ncbi:hypothetical protein [Kitasatospora sp. NPDC090308]|uniref:hypothetical protein n=1 Tax=Kitasatospora sp. NPDC090308 TaxID=3364082 RepID=UPI00382CED7A